MTGFLVLGSVAGDYVPLALSVSGLLAVAWGGVVWLRRTSADSEPVHVRDQAVFVILIIVAVLVVILALPIDPDARNSLLSLFGLLITAVVGLAATTHVGNGLAGIMLRSRSAFRPGDFIRTGEHFGRVTGIGLFHTEIQTEDRDLTAIPNVLLVTAPMTVVRATGTIVSATVSLGYDVAHGRVVEVLTEAASKGGLKDPFVLVTELGDFSVTYRTSGLLENPRTLISARSALRTQMLDGLHGAGIEIVSPTFMNQRVVDPARAVIAPVRPPGAPDPNGDADIEAIVFDKAELAGSVEALRDRRLRLDERIATVEAQLAESSREDHDGYAGRLEKLRSGIELIDKAIAAREEEQKNEQ